MKSFNYLRDHILHQALMAILSISWKKHETFTDNPPIKIYVERGQQDSRILYTFIPSFLNFHILRYGRLIKILNFQKALDPAK